MNMYKDSDRINPIYTWPVIIIAIILFCPVGIYLIYKRTQTNKKYTSFFDGKISTF